MNGMSFAPGAAGSGRRGRRRVSICRVAGDYGSVERVGVLLGSAAAALIFGVEPAQVTREMRDRAKTARRRRRSKARDDSALRPRPVPELDGAKVLIVDDDIRNIYSLTSVLESYGVEVLHAERGRDGILILEQTPGVDAALIDIMMPEIDGYETIRRIRAKRETASVPLIAVTAKAMKGDRQKCLAAGASDYIAKPVDIDLLLALLRVWVTRARNRAGEPMPLTQTAAE